MEIQQMIKEEYVKKSKISSSVWVQTKINHGISSQLCPSHGRLAALIPGNLEHLPNLTTGVDLLDGNHLPPDSLILLLVVK